MVKSSFMASSGSSSDRSVLGDSGDRMGPERLFSRSADVTGDPEYARSSKSK